MTIGPSTSSGRQRSSPGSMIGPAALQKTLATIRVVNGGVALLAPDVLARRLGVDTATSPGLGYGLRLFGVRTVLLGIRLWRAPRRADDADVAETVFVHAADTAAAVVVLARGELPRKGAVIAVAISAFNTALAVLLNWTLRKHR